MINGTIRRTGWDSSLGTTRHFRMPDYRPAPLGEPAPKRIGGDPLGPSRGSRRQIRALDHRVKTMAHSVPSPSLPGLIRQPAHQRQGAGCRIKSANDGQGMLFGRLALDRPAEPAPYEVAPTAKPAPGAVAERPSRNGDNRRRARARTARLSNGPSGRCHPVPKGQSSRSKG